LQENEKWEFLLCGGVVDVLNPKLRYSDTVRLMRWMELDADWYY